VLRELASTVTKKMEKISYAQRSLYRDDATLDRDIA
jgi:hypothetical protein